MMDAWNWIRQDGANAKKHQGWKHPLATIILHYGIVVVVSYSAHDAFFGQQRRPADHHHHNNNISNNSNLNNKMVAQGLAIYVLWLFLWRIFVLQPPQRQQQSYFPHYAGVVYEMTWLCNVTMLVGALALASQRPLLALAYSLVVGIDQFLWYVDLGGFFLHQLLLLTTTLSSKTTTTTTTRPWFPIGVARYLTWPGTTWTSRITCTHHLWTIPIVWYATIPMNNNNNNWTLQDTACLWCLTLIVITTNVLLSRWMTPFFIGNSKYLNVNLSHEIWKDIKFSFLQIQYDHPPTWLYLLRLVSIWQIASTLILIGWWVWQQTIISRS